MKIFYEGKDKISIGEEWQQYIDDKPQHFVSEYTIERHREFFDILFSRLNETELIMCQKIIEANLAERFDK